MKRKKRISKRGWNWYAFTFNIAWYFKYGILGEGIMLMAIALASCGLAILPIAFYCGARGNEDRYRYIVKQMVEL